MKMFNNVNEICLSSIEFSIFYRSSQLCPHCLNPIPFSQTVGEVNVSSFLLLIGVGSIICYKFFKKKKIKLFINDIIPIFQIDNINSSESHSSCSSNYNSDQIIPSPQYIVSYENNEDDFTYSYKMDRSFSLASQLSVLGDGTVAKLDQLLMHIEELKRAMADLDVHLLNVKNYDSNLIYAEDRYNDNDELHSQSHSLEWDANDIGICNELNNNNIKHSNTLKLAIGQEQITSSPMMISAPSSGFGSLLQTPEDESLEIIYSLLEEAKKLGLLNELIKFLVVLTKQKKDSFKD